MISHVLLDDSHCLSRVELDDGVYSPPPGGLVGEFASVPGARDDAPTASRAAKRFAVEAEALRGRAALTITRCCSVDPDDAISEGRV